MTPELAPALKAMERPPVAISAELIDRVERLVEERGRGMNFFALELFVALLTEAGREIPDLSVPF